MGVDSALAHTVPTNFSFPTAPSLDDKSISISCRNFSYSSSPYLTFHSCHNKTDAASLNTCFVLKSSEGAVEMSSLYLCIPYYFNAVAEFFYQLVRLNCLITFSYMSLRSMSHEMFSHQKCSRFIT